MKKLFILLTFFSLSACATDGVSTQGLRYDSMGRPIVNEAKPPIQQPVSQPSQPSQPDRKVVAQAPPISTAAPAQTPAPAQSPVQRTPAPESRPTQALGVTAAPTSPGTIVSPPKTWIMLVMMVKHEHVPGLLSNPTKNDVFLMFVAEYPSQAVCYENAGKAMNAAVPPGHAVYVLCSERRAAVAPTEQPAAAAPQAPRAGG